MTAVQPLDFENPEDYSCRKRWPINATCGLMFILALIIFLAPNANVVDCDPYTDESCSDDGTKEVPQKWSLIVGTIFLLLGLILCKMSHGYFYKKDKKDYKEAKIQAELAKREEELTPAQKAALEAASGGAIVGAEMAFDGGAAGIAAAAAAAVVSVGAAVSEKKNESSSSSTHANSGTTPNQSTTQSRAVPISPNGNIAPQPNDSEKKKKKKKKKKKIGLEGEMAKTYGIKWSDAKKYLDMAKKDMGPTTNPDMLLEAARAIMEQEKEEDIAWLAIENTIVIMSSFRIFLKNIKNNTGRKLLSRFCSTSHETRQ